MVRCFVYHSISVFRFGMLHGRKCALTHVLYVLPNVKSTFSANSFSWETYICWLISRNSLPTPGVTNMVPAGTRSPARTTWIALGPILKKALTCSVASHRWISSFNGSVMKDELSNFFISEVCTKLVPLRIIKYPRSSSKFQKGWSPLTYTLVQCFLIGGTAPQGASINFQRGYALCNVKSLINKCTNKYICFYNLFNVKGAWNKRQLLERSVLEKRLRPTALV